MAAISPPANPDEVLAGWEGILEPGERILWHGRPSGRLTLYGIDPTMLMVGFGFTVIALLFIGIGLAIGSVMFVLFPMLHLTVGLGLIFGGPVSRAYVRRNSWYTLTDRRAVIATDHWPSGRQVKTWPIVRNMPLMLIERPGLGVAFDLGPNLASGGQGKVRARFEMIGEAAEEVLAMMESIRQGKR